MAGCARRGWVGLPNNEDGPATGLVWVPHRAIGQVEHERAGRSLVRVDRGYGASGWIVVPLSCDQVLDLWEEADLLEKAGYR